MTRVLIRAMLGSLLACGAANAAGFPDGRDGDADFKVVKGNKSTIKLESSMPAETIKGSTHDVTGTLKINPAKLDSASGSFTVPVKKIDTGIPMRNEHMASSDWLNAAEHPDVTFTVTGIEKAEVNKKKAVTATLKGKMKLHGVEKDEAIPVTMAYVKDKAKDGNRDTLLITAKFDVKLSDYKVKGKTGAIGSKVNDTIKMNIAITLASGEEKEKPAQQAKPRIKAKAKAD